MEHLVLVSDLEHLPTEYMSHMWLEESTRLGGTWLVDQQSSSTLNLMRLRNDVILRGSIFNGRMTAS